MRREGAGYYLSDLARELPDADGPAGRWAGTAAAGLGLDGPIGATGFERLLAGRHPRTGHRLGTGRTTVAAYDLTFSAPKSVSVVFALGGTDTAHRVVAAHEEAVCGALWYLEGHGVTAVRRDGEVLPTGGLVAGRFTHALNRNGDPHLHTHVVAANLVHGTDGRWGACDRRGVDAHRPAASAVYEAHLRAALTAALGVRWVRDEIDGVAPALLGEFSTRSADIRRLVYERGGAGRRVARVEGRPAKTPSPRYADLTVAWRQRADAAGLTDSWAPAETADRAVPALVDEHRFAGVLSLTPHRGARRRDVVAALATAAPGGAEAVALEHLVDAWVPPGPVGVAEPLHVRRNVGPANHHLRALGSRPLDPGDHAVWLDAARALDAYRTRWNLGRVPDPLGAAPPSSLPALQLADRLRVVRRIDVARARLGLRQPAVVELDRGW